MAARLRHARPRRRRPLKPPGPATDQLVAGLVAAALTVAAFAHGMRWWG